LVFVHQKQSKKQTTVESSNKNEMQISTYGCPEILKDITFIISRWMILKFEKRGKFEKKRHTELS
jgi:hypothetical protein